MRIVGALAALAALVPSSLATTPTLLGIGYICAAERKQPAQTPPRLVMASGMGSGGLAARAGTAEAQQWLDYGLKLYHAFYHEDAKAAFARAVELDPACSLCAWGQALGFGPTLNYLIPDEQTAEALTAAKRAASLAKTPMERDLAAALESRYDPAVANTVRERTYAEAMAALAERHPEEADLTTLAAHALITPARRRDFDGVARAMPMLERALARNPNDTAAIHYYIHAAEFAGRAGVALPYAERLAGLAPGASHLVHMAAHTQFRVGRYEDVAVVNAEALKVDAEYSQVMAAKGTLGEPRYYAHNMLFGVGGALMAGDRDLSLKYADHAPIAYPVGSTGPRAVVIARTLVAYGRFAPERALALPQPPAADPAFHQIYWRYARGEALASSGDADGVLAESRAIEKIDAPADSDGSRDLQRISAEVLAGRAAMLKGKPKAAAKHYAAAAAVQEKVYAFAFDPPPWWYPIRRSVAAARLKAGDNRAAAAEARKSLAAWPGDALALRVLSEAERRLDDLAGAAQHGAEARQAWRGDLDALSLDVI